MNENRLLIAILAQVKRVFTPSTPYNVGMPKNENQLLTLIRNRFKELAA